MTDAPLDCGFMSLPAEAQAALSGSHGPVLRSEPRPAPGREEAIQRLREASERRKARQATPDAEARLAEEFMVWAPLRREATSALLGDDE